MTKQDVSLDEQSLPVYLAHRGLLDGVDGVRVEAAGDGNINWVRRVSQPGRRSLIVKHARRRLEKFPEYEADPERLTFEARYMEVARPHDGDGVLPALLHFDESGHTLVLEDLGAVPRMDEALAAGVNVAAALEPIASFLGRVHAVTAGESLADRFANDGMRRLHGDHIFHLPFRPNDFPLGDEIRPIAESIWSNAEVVRVADAAYRRYLAPAGSLVHADVQGSNILLTESGPKLLDAEIAHVGDPAFDIATLLAHVLLPGIAHDRHERARGVADQLWAAYVSSFGPRSPSREAADVYTAIEMIRRTIGAARVVVVAEPTAAQRCVETALAMLLGRPG